jgi:putative hydrolase of the HAD superfamily
MSIEGLLFDMGGVVIDIDFDPAFQAWSKYSDLPIEEIRSRFAMDAPYRKHERGEIESVAYFAHLRDLLQLDADHTTIANDFNAIFLEEISATVDDILRIRSRYPCYAFTNSNPSHQEFWESSYPRAVQCFHRVFVSSELGLRKPEPEAFAAISRETGIDLANILFFDDMEENIIGARSVGMQAVLVKSHLDVKHALQQI